MTARRLEVADLGRRPHGEVLELQRQLRAGRLDGSRPHDMLLLVEHEPVYTLGRGTQAASLPVSGDALRALGAEVTEIERGGDVTWHGPGQLVAYPILHLGQHRQDLHWYLRALEATLLEVLGDLGLPAGTVAGRTGVWVGGRKIASIGIHVRQWVTLHGFALNVDPDLGWFDAIVPCGLHGVEMTSVARELGLAGTPHDLMSRTRNAVVARLAATFDLTPADGLPEEAEIGPMAAVKACDSATGRSPFNHG